MMYNEGMKRKKRMGRPPKPADEKYGEQINSRISKAERAQLRAEAKRLGTTVSALLMRPWREGKEEQR